MKKVFLTLVALTCSLMLSGCGTSDDEQIVKNLSKKINGSTSYRLQGTFELINNEESYTYDINVDYKKDDKFKVSLVNKTNNHEQIILRNADGVYVLTPSLNKSFKFQSDWPYNNSQTYILQTIVEDIENDSDKDIQKNSDGFIITTSVHYSNKKELVKQNIYLNKDGDLLKVEVLNTENQPKIIMNFNKIEYDIDLKDDIFSIDKNVDNDTSIDTPVSSIDGIVFPMYVPSDTYLTSQDIVSINGGQRAILTFNGEKPFTVIQETFSSTNPVDVVVDGEPYIVMDTIGVLSDSYVSWISSGIEYSVISEKMTQEELLSVANSISIMPVAK